MKLGHEKGAGDGVKFKCINEMKETIEDEIRDLCREWYIEAKYFLKCAVTIESKIFYLKIKADTFRYLAQFETGKKSQKAIIDANFRYEEAVEEAKALEPTHPLKLGLHLNLAILKYEIEQDFTEAIKIAEKAFDDALLVLPSLEDTDQNETLRVMIILEHNIDLWKLDEEHQRKKAEHLEFSIKHQSLIAEGFE